jgi:quinol monooxygenase YgiN
LKKRPTNSIGLLGFHVEECVYGVLLALHANNTPYTLLTTAIPVGEPNTFMLIEEYADEAAAASHSETEHMKRLGAMLGTMLAGPPEIKKYNVTSTEML